MWVALFWSLPNNFIDAIEIRAERRHERSNPAITSRSIRGDGSKVSQRGCWRYLKAQRKEAAEICPETLTHLVPDIWHAPLYMTIQSDSEQSVDSKSGSPSTFLPEVIFQTSCGWTIPQSSWSIRKIGVRRRTVHLTVRRQSITERHITLSSDLRPLEGACMGIQCYQKKRQI